MNQDLEGRVKQLEQKLSQLERSWSETRLRDQRRKTRDKWFRIALMILLGAAYWGFLQRALTIS